MKSFRILHPNYKSMNKYILTEEAIKAINNKDTRRTLLSNYKCTEQTVRNWISKNSESGVLTSKGVIELIMKETKLKSENKIIKLI